MARKKRSFQFMLCIKDNDYPASLDVRKVYQAMPNAVAAARHLVRIIDESGEDYLFPEDYFVPIDVPIAAVNAFVHAT